MKKILVACLLVFSCLSCADEKNENENNEIKALNFSYKTIEKRLDNCVPEEGDCTFISLSFPVAEYGNGEAERINRTIESFIVNTIDFQDDGSSEKPEELAQNFIRDYKDTALEFPDYVLAWEATISGKVNYHSTAVISLKFNTDMFTGGAHGYRSINYLNFDPETGKNLACEDIFTSEFTEFAEKSFREKQNIPLEVNINSTGMFFENDEFKLPQNIGITKNSIILHYNAYDIAPYADGDFIMTYTKDEIAQYLKIKEDKVKS